jgi:hypothetical protein
MNKSLIIAWVIGGILGAGCLVVFAQDTPKDRVVLTPSKFYDFIESGQQVDINHGRRLLVLEYKITELERKMSGADGKGGVQHEITRLHSMQQQLEKHCNFIRTPNKKGRWM